mmetsp:Transcript_55188/g.63435  ORF Transcript_55188/g.63435 Transcript_55188/m.63435 type:complete len:92 (+) Transcript_55188:80-355(+)
MSRGDQRCSGGPQVGHKNSLTSQQREAARQRLLLDQQNFAHITFSLKVFGITLAALAIFWGLMKWSGVMEEPHRVRSSGSILPKLQKQHTP